MLNQIANKFKVLVLVSALLSATLPITPAKSQTINNQSQQQNNTTKRKLLKNQPAKLSQTNLLAEDVKPSVVRVALGCKAKVYSPKNGKIYDLEQMTSHGSGFFVNSNGYIITNAHVTSAENCQNILQPDLESKINDDGESWENVETELKWVDVQPIRLVYLPNQAQFPFEIINSGAIAGEGKDVSLIKINIANAPVLKLADSAQVQLLDSITVVGYPGIVEKFSVFSEESFYEASFTRGQVSAKKNLKDGTPMLQITAPVPHGNSGGPVLNEQGEVIGLVTFGPNDDFTFIFTSNTIQEFLDSAQITNQQGLVNLKYREGLEFYSQGKYNQALQSFELVKHLFPQHSEVEKFVDQCQQVIADTN